MMNTGFVCSATAKAVLVEISEALQRFIDHGDTWIIFTNRMSLSPEERQEIRDFLGVGSIKINLTDTDEPAEWLESGITGIWYGVFYDQKEEPILEIIEIGKFPQIPSAQTEDVNAGRELLQKRLYNKNV